jgi:hypothetical protein
VRDRVGTGFALIRPERQHFYEAGLQQSVGSRLLFNVAVYHKDGTSQQDNNNFLNTPIIFPMALSSIRVNAAEARVIVPEIRGFSGTFSLTHYRAISTPPFTGGLFIGNAALDALSQGPFVIDHDQKLSLHGVATYTRRRWFVTGSIRHDSGLVVNPSDPATVAADPDYRDLLPYVDLTARPPRTRPRTIGDISAGYRRPGERGWEAVLQVANLWNSTALYNFQSLFVGTRLVQPRTVALRLRWFF